MTEINLNTVEDIPDSVAETYGDIAARCNAALEYIDRRRARDQQEVEIEIARIRGLPWYKQMFIREPYVSEYAFWYDDDIADLQIRCKLRKDFESSAIVRLRIIEKDMKENPL